MVLPSGNWTIFGACVVGVLVVARRLHRQNRKRQKLARTPATEWLDAGNFFGLDLGGTLTKVVYFDPDHANGKHNDTDGEVSPSSSATLSHLSTSVQPPPEGAPPLTPEEVEHTFDAAASKLKQFICQFVDVSLSRHNGCGVQSNGQMSCWGDNSSGQSYPP